MKAVFVTEFGGIDKLRYEEVATPVLGDGQALVKLAYTGVNFIDIYFRTGLYAAPSPVVLGMEASGIVEAVAPGVDSVKPGDRVAYAMARGSYAEYAVVPAWQLVKVPAQVGLDLAAASMLQGMTAHYLTHSTYPLRPGEICLVHAAAGGAGQWTVAAAKIRGAQVIGTVSTAAKAEIARAAGCDHVINYAEADFSVEVKRITEGRGVDVVYDSVGAATWEKSLDSLRPRGMMVSFGNASGPVPPFPPLTLSQKGSLFVTRPTLAHYTSKREELEWRASDILSWVQGNLFTPRIYKVYPLAEAGAAQEALAARLTSGKLLLQP
ncbi:MAG: quinone oxidoreductase [Bryobacteraceae bacterium]|nr:quinone oxidoreductase [Bryobacteraceae bacterium]